MKTKMFEIILATSKEVANSTMQTAVDINRQQKHRAARLLREKRDKIICTKDITDPVVQNILQIMTKQIKELSA